MLELATNFLDTSRPLRLPSGGMLATHPYLKKFGYALIALALFLTAGGHYALLQTVAWTTMVNDFSRTGSLSMAVEKTFDGRHPCSLCKKITKARSTEEKTPATVKAEKKAECSLRLAARKFLLPSAFRWSMGRHFSYSIRSVPTLRPFLFPSACSFSRTNGVAPFMWGHSI